MSNTTDAIGALNGALQVAIQMLIRAQEVSAMIQAAQAEGRDLTDEELLELAGKDDAARKALADVLSASPAA